MANYIDHTNEAIDQIAGSFWTTVRDQEKMEKEIENELLRKGEDYKDQNRIKRIMEDRISALQADAKRNIETALDKLRLAYADDKAKLDRSQLRANTGERIVEQYAKTHNIGIDQARSELKEYATNKTRMFTDSLPDRYAAIRHKDQELSREDSITAHRYYSDELKALGYYEKENLVKQADYLVKQNGLAVLHSWNTSGAAIARKLRDQAKKE